MGFVSVWWVFNMYGLISYLNSRGKKKDSSSYWFFSSEYPLKGGPPASGTRFARKGKCWQSPWMGVPAFKGRPQKRRTNIKKKPFYRRKNQINRRWQLFIAGFDFIFEILNAISDHQALIFDLFKDT